MTNAIQTAIDELKVAFPPHPLDVEHMILGWGIGYTDGHLFKAEARGKRWDELPTQLLEFHREALLYFGPAALVEVIPAYIAAALRRERELDMLPTFLLSVLNRDADSESFDARFGRLTPAQRHAITHALEVWAELLEDSPHQRPIIEALESYWRTRSEK
jgi:hypothetical protein